MSHSSATDRSQLIFLGGVVSAVLAFVLLILAYTPQ